MVGLFSEQRRPAVIFVAADVRAVHSHFPDRIPAPTRTDAFEKLPFRINYVLLLSFNY